MTEERSIVVSENREQSLVEVKNQIQTIHKLLAEVMHKGEHYDTIPGCGAKPVLLKAGAEKLATLFRLAPTYEVQKEELGNGHREYQVKCTIVHQPTGTLIAESFGSCNTLESKYRYRTEVLNIPIPKEYWDTRDPNLIGGGSVRKVDGKWVVYRKIDHDNPADYYNTCLKMALKRAFVHAIITATATSDIFTQDLEDMAEVMPTTVSPTSPTPTSAPTTVSNHLTDADITRFWTIMTKAKITKDMVHKILKESFNLDSVRDIPKDQLEAVINAIIGIE